MLVKAPLSLLPT
jgi:hypothetical protein